MRIVIMKIKQQKHYGTLISQKFGGKDPLEGISIYYSGDYWHFVTYGLTELYDIKIKVLISPLFMGISQFLGTSLGTNIL